MSFAEQTNKGQKLAPDNPRAGNTATKLNRATSPVATGSTRSQRYTLLDCFRQLAQRVDSASLARGNRTLGILFWVFRSG